MKLKRILALGGVVILVALYLLTLVFALLKTPYSIQMFYASVTATIAVPIIIHLFLMIHNVREGRKAFDNPYTYRDKKDS